MMLVYAALREKLAGRAVLVTGAGGCIGATAIRILHDIGARPVAYDIDRNRTRLNLIMDKPEQIDWVQGDICDSAHLAATLARYNITAILHLAALQVPFCKIDPLGSAKVNVLGTTHIFEAARQNKIKRLAYASSVAAPAMGDNEFLSTLYGAHKICTEQMAAVYWQDWQQPSLCIRPGVIYGPGRDQGMSAAPTLALFAALSGQSYHIPFTGMVAFVHVEDAALRFIASLCQDGHGAFVFDMQGTPANIDTVITGIRDLIPKAEIRANGAALPFPCQRDDGRLDEYLAMPAYRSFEQGLKDTLAVFERAQQCGKLTMDYMQTVLGTQA